MPRGNPQNLVLITKETASEMGRRGAIAANKTKRRKKTMKQLCELIGNSQVDNAKAKKIAESLGLDLEEVTYNFLAIFGQYQKAINEKDTRAIEFLRDTSGEKPLNQVEVNTDYEDLTPLAELLKPSESENNE